MLLETFKKIDVDSSGYVTMHEFHKFYVDVINNEKPRLDPYPELNLSDLAGLAYARKYLWLTFDTHETELGKVCGPAMFFLIVFSVLSLCVATVPQVKD